MKTLLVTGATSLVGDFLLPRLAGAGWQTIAVSRQPRVSVHDSQWLIADITVPAATSWPTVDAMIHLAPLWLLPPLLQQIPFRSERRVIAFGSTSRLSKAASPDPSERQMAQKLADAESALLALPDASVTIFRPTLIYGAGRDQNVSLIARTIHRFGFFPLIGAATGKRQPVHADDLASACLSALSRPQTAGRIYDLPGGETLAYRNMVEQIFQALGRSPRFVRLPEATVRWGLRTLSLMPRWRKLTPEMASRMNVDLAFDASRAGQELDYQPRPFRPSAEDLGVSE